MGVRIVRWKSGSGGDTLMKMLLDSDPTLCSQNQYLDMTDNATRPDSSFVNSFQLSQVALMSLWNFDTVDVKTLMYELELLESSCQKWLLKSHCYIKYPYPVLDLVPCAQSLPFVVKAAMCKNFSRPNLVAPYHPLRSKIKDSGMLYQFDCFNLAVDRVRTQYDAVHQLPVRLLLGPYHELCTELQTLGFTIDPNTASYHSQWIKKNRSLMPTDLYIDMTAAGIYDDREPGLTVEERVCMLALNGGRLRDLLAPGTKKFSS